MTCMRLLSCVITSGTTAGLSVPLVNRVRPRSFHTASKVSGRNLHSGSLFGDANDDYTAMLTIDGQVFTAIVDTGSNVLAVAGSRDLGCESFLDTSQGCDRTVPVGVTYGSGYWSGVDCWRNVWLGGIEVPNYEVRSPAIALGSVARADLLC
jgi:hypothetical protein